MCERENTFREEKEEEEEEQERVQIWCWRLFMIKLWNHGFLDARSMNNCNIVLEQFQKQKKKRESADDMGRLSCLLVFLN